MEDWKNQAKDDLFASLNSGPFMQGNNTNNQTSQGGSVFDGNANPWSGNDFNVPGNQNVGAQGDGEPKDLLDHIIDGSIAIVKKIGEVLAGAGISVFELFKVLKTKTADETLKNSWRMLLTFIPLFVLGIVLIIFGYITDTTLYDVGIVIVSACFIDALLSATLHFSIKINVYENCTDAQLDAEIEKEAEQNIDELNTVTDLASDYSESFDDIMNDILGEEEPVEDTVEDTSDEIDWGAPVTAEEPEPPKEIAEPEIIDGMVVNNQTLWQVFSPLFPAYNKDFAKRTEWTQDNEYSEKWANLMIIIQKLFAADIYGIDIKEIKTKGLILYKVEDAPMFTYCELKKPTGKSVDSSRIEECFNNYSTDLIETICDPNQLFDDKAQNKISAKVWMDGDHYCIVLTKPNKNPVLIGDILQNSKVSGALKSGKNTPVVLAVDDVGDPLIAEMTHKSQMMYSGLIGGGAGSGKSWFFFATIIQMAAFNLPTDVQFIMVDPKPDTAFNEMELLPHTARLIQAGKPEGIAAPTLEMLRMLCKEEGPRRQKLFATEQCSNIQDWRKKGHKEMPYIMVFLDEYINLRDEIKRYGDEMYEEQYAAYQEDKKNNPKPSKIDMVKELDGLMAVATTKLRAAGIYFYIISHRFTGVVDKQTRVLSPLKLVLKSNKLLTEVFEGADIQNFTKALINSGDCALKMGERDLNSGKTLGVCIEDADTYKVIENISKGFYKMGVEMPDMKPLGKEYVKDLQEMHRRLYPDDQNIAQFDQNTSFDTEDEEIKENNDLISDDADDLFGAPKKAAPEEDEEDTESYIIKEDGSIVDNPNQKNKVISKEPQFEGLDPEDEEEDLKLDENEDKNIEKNDEDIELDESKEEEKPKKKAKAKKPKAKKEKIEDEQEENELKLDEEEEPETKEDGTLDIFSEFDKHEDSDIQVGDDELTFEDNEEPVKEDDEEEELTFEEESEGPKLIKKSKSEDDLDEEIL